jgi:hypothetical protein
MGKVYQKTSKDGAKVASEPDAANRKAGSVTPNMSRPTVKPIKL